MKKRGELNESFCVTNFARTLVRHLSQACNALGEESSFLFRFGLFLVPLLTSEDTECSLPSLLVFLGSGDGLGRPSRGDEVMDI